MFFFFFQAEDGIRDLTVTGVQTCALPISCLPYPGNYTMRLVRRLTNLVLTEQYGQAGLAVARGERSMATTEIWSAVLAEREALAADLRELSSEDWAKPSLCGAWTVRDVLAHMTSAAKLTPPAFFGKIIGSGFSFDKVQEKGVAAQRGASPADTLANFESVVTSVKHPPGPNQTWLGEVIVHSQDIRRALGIEHAYPTGAVV